MNVLTIGNSFTWSLRRYFPDVVKAAGEKLHIRFANFGGCELERHWSYISAEEQSEICRIYKASWLSGAPAIAVVAGNYQECWKRLEGDPIADVDCAIVMEHITLAAADCGLGTCWICAFQRAEMDSVMGLTAPWRSVAITPVGFAAKQPAERPCKPENELFEVI